MKTSMRHRLCAWAGWIPVICVLPLSAQIDFEFTNIQRQTNGDVSLTWTAPVGTHCCVDVSTNLPDWQALVTKQSPGVNQHLDGGAAYLNQRYYRARQLQGTGIITGDHVSTSEGDVVIHPVDHASLVLRWNGLMIYNDPVGSSTLYSSFPRADLILVGHSHQDHYNATTITAVLGAGGIVVAPQVVYNAMSTTLRARTYVLINGAVTNVAGFSIEAVPAYNFTANYHPKGVGNSYVLTLGGRRIFFSGDTEDVPEMRALTNIDVAFMAMNIPYTMTVEKAASAVRAFRPKVVYPYHFQNADDSYSNLDLFKRMVGTDLGIEVRVRAWY